MVFGRKLVTKVLIYMILIFGILLLGFDIGSVYYGQKSCKDYNNNMVDYFHK